MSASYGSVSEVAGQRLAPGRNGAPVRARLLIPTDDGLSNRQLGAEISFAD